MALDTQTVRSIIGAQTTAGASEETVNLIVNGAVGAASVAVAANTRVVIKSVVVQGAAAANWRLQATTDGVSFFDIGLFNNGALPVSNLYTPQIGWVITGGANVAFRVRVATPGGAAAVNCTLRSYTES